jgi:hypothetical protein
MSKLHKTIPAPRTLEPEPPGGGARCIFILQCIVPPKKDANQYAHQSISVNYIEDVECPYYYRDDPAKTTNMIKKGLDNMPLLKFKSGGATNFISIKSVPSYVKPGFIYSGLGMSYGVFRKLSDDKIVDTQSVSITSIIQHEYDNLSNLKMSIPFSERSFSLQRDVVSSSGAYDVLGEKVRRFLWVTIDGKKIDNRETEPESLYGVFGLNLDEHGEFIVNDSMLSYTPYIKNSTVVAKTRLALTGGKESVTEPAKNAQVIMEQKDLNGNITIYNGQCKLYGVESYQIDWSFAPIIVPHFRGDLFAWINRKDTKAIEYIAGVNIVAIPNPCFHPNWPKMCRELFGKLSWASCMKLKDHNNNLIFADYAQMYYQYYDANSIFSAEAINITRFTGDLTPIVKAAADGDVEFYVLPNFTSEDNIKALSTSTEDEIVASCNLSTNFKRLSDKKIIVFAVPTGLGLATAYKMLKPKEEGVETNNKNGVYNRVETNNVTIEGVAKGVVIAEIHPEMDEEFKEETKERKIKKAKN